MVRTFPVIDGGLGGPDLCFDFNGDGRTDVVFTTGTYRHPHAVYVYDYTTGQRLWHHDFADGPDMSGVADLNGDGRPEMFLVVAFDCHADPPVGDYDSHHCYAVLFDHRGQRLWKQTYQHCLNGFLADLDGDGKPKIIITHELPNRGALHVLDPKTGEPLHTLTGLAAQIGRGWTVADVNGDGRQEIVLGDGERIHVIDGKAQMLASKPMPAARVLAANDLNGDGRVEILACQQSELVLLDGELKELARYRTGGKIVEAIVTDLDRDGRNEVILRVEEDGKIHVEIVRCAEADAAVDCTYPGNVAKTFLAALWAGNRAEAAACVAAAARDAVLQKLDQRQLPEKPELAVSVREDDAEVVVTNAGRLRLRMRFTDNAWWITEVVP